MRAVEHRAVEPETAVGQMLDFEFGIERRVAPHARAAAQTQADARADARAVRGGRGVGIPDHAHRRVPRAAAQQRAHHAHRIGVAARAGVVLRIGDDDGPGRRAAQADRLGGRRVGREQRHAPARLVADELREQRVGRALRRVGLERVRPYGRPALREIGGRKAGGERHRYDAVPLELREQPVRAARRLRVRAHAVDRNQERQPAYRAMQRPGLGREALEHPRGTLAGLRHVDVRIRAVGNERARMRGHSRGDVRMQIERHDDRHPLADDPPHAREELAFAVVELLGDHRAVQVEIDRVEAARLDRGDDLAADPLERAARHVRRRARARPHDRQQRVPARLRGPDEAADRHVDVAQRQHAGAARERRKAFAANEALIRRARRRERVGFVLKACNQNVHVAFLYGERHREPASIGRYAGVQACWQRAALLARATKFTYRCPVNNGESSRERIDARDQPSTPAVFPRSPDPRHHPRRGGPHQHVAVRHHAADPAARGRARRRAIRAAGARRAADGGRRAPARVLAGLPVAAGKARRSASRAQGPSAGAHPDSRQRGVRRHARRRRARAVLREVSEAECRRRHARGRHDTGRSGAQPRAHRARVQSAAASADRASRELAAAGRAAVAARSSARATQAAGDRRRSARVPARADAADVRHRPRGEDAGAGREHRDPADVDDEFADGAQAHRHGGELHHADRSIRRVPRNRGRRADDGADRAPDIRGHACAADREIGAAAGAGAGGIDPVDRDAVGGVRGRDGRRRENARAARHAVTPFVRRRTLEPVKIAACGPVAARLLRAENKGSASASALGSGSGSASAPTTVRHDVRSG
ncbi:transcriptional regulator, LysR family domain protein [Burkholderia pseudomallei]|nr:transcriptional regulator, LysR family domain protein [Burkholderia pseudomallei]